MYPRKDGKALWMVYRDRNGRRIRESTNTEDWQEAQRKLRDRLQARDDKILDIVRKGEQIQFADWVDLFPGELFQAAHPRGKDAPCERAVRAVASNRRSAGIRSSTSRR